MTAYSETDTDDGNSSTDVYAKFTYDKSMPGSPVSSSVYRIDTGTPVEIWGSYTYLADGRLSSMLTS